MIYQCPKEQKKKEPSNSAEIEREKERRGKSFEHKQIALFVHENVFCIYKLPMPKCFN